MNFLTGCGIYVKVKMAFRRGRYAVLKGAVFEAVAERYADRIYAIALNHFKVHPTRMISCRRYCPSSTEVILHLRARRISSTGCAWLSTNARRSAFGVAAAGISAGGLSCGSADGAGRVVREMTRHRQRRRQSAAMRSLLGDLKAAEKNIVSLYTSIIMRIHDTEGDRGDFEDERGDGARPDWARSQNFEGGSFRMYDRTKRTKQTQRTKSVPRGVCGGACLRKLEKGGFLYET